MRLGHFDRKESANGRLAVSVSQSPKIYLQELGTKSSNWHGHVSPALESATNMAARSSRRICEKTACPYLLGFLTFGMDEEKTSLTEAYWLVSCTKMNLLPPYSFPLEIGSSPYEAFQAIF